MRIPGTQKLLSQTRSNQFRVTPKVLLHRHRDALSEFNINSPDARRLQNDFLPGDLHVPDTPICPLENFHPRANKGSKAKSENDFSDLIKIQNKESIDIADIIEKLKLAKSLAEKQFDTCELEASNNEAVRNLMEKLTKYEKETPRADVYKFKNASQGSTNMSAFYVYLMSWKLYLDDKVNCGATDANTLMLQNKIHQRINLFKSKTKDSQPMLSTGAWGYTRLRHKRKHLDENFQQTLKAEREAYNQMDVSYASSIFRNLQLQQKQ